MSYKLTRINWPVGTTKVRNPNEQLIVLEHSQDHYIDSAVAGLGVPATTSNISLNALIRAQVDLSNNPVVVLPSRLRVLITNLDTTKTLYVGYSSTTSATNYKWLVLPNAVSPLDISLHGNADVYLSSSSAGPIISITEVG